MIVEFDFGVEGVEGGPSLSQGDAAVSVFSLEFAGNAAYRKKVNLYLYKDGV